MENYYEILGIPLTADRDRIRRAYLEKVRTVHPDINPSENAAKEFIRIKEAYDTLFEENKRAVYDMKLKQAATTQQNIKNFHYDFKSNFGGKQETGPRTPSTALIAGLIAFLIALAGGIAFVFLSK
ncbi:MAG TPA: DnaJ domain-containing protein [Bacteroidia bacterium]|jgi:molecular chaperone DnaJ